MTKGQPITINHGGKKVKGTIYDVQKNDAGAVTGVRVQLPGMVVYRPVVDGKVQ